MVESAITSVWPTIHSELLGFLEPRFWTASEALKELPDYFRIADDSVNDCLLLAQSES